ncbi:MAG TPA: hypothetical protein VFL16_17205 [Steroidobacteraceae bacterium]|jgi:hypothetical protein|nr:hypothetical protein [Steroidobacteraceae bacterium]
MEHRRFEREDVPADDAELLRRKGERLIGPSDSSDTGSDMMGLGNGDDTSDREGTGERASVEDLSPDDNSDIAADRVVEADEAGLGGGLDQAEEAQLGITDEELTELFGRRK